MQYRWWTGRIYIVPQEKNGFVGTFYKVVPEVILDDSRLIFTFKHAEP